MAILIECPKCKLRQPVENRRCGTKKGCNLLFKKGDGKVYWIEYYTDGQRRRERIGLSKKLAETTLDKRKVAIAEGRKLDIVKEERVTLKELVKGAIEENAPVLDDTQALLEEQESLLKERARLKDRLTEVNARLEEIEDLISERIAL